MNAEFLERIQHTVEQANKDQWLNALASLQEAQKVALAELDARLKRRD